MAKLKPKALLAQSKVKKGPSQISVITIFTYLVLGVVVVSSVYAAYKYWVGKWPEVTAAGVEGNETPNYVTDFVVVSSSWIILVAAA